MILLRAKSWQVFSVIAVPMLVSAITHNQTIDEISDIVTYASGFIWLLFVGKNLNELNDNNRKSDSFFIINSFYILLALSISRLSYTGQESEMTIPVLALAIYFVFATIYVVTFVASAFYIAQEMRENAYTKYRLETVWFCFFIPLIGIWLIQPRLNRYFTD